MMISNDERISVWGATPPTKRVTVETPMHYTPLTVPNSKVWIVKKHMKNKHPRDPLVGVVDFSHYHVPSTHIHTVGIVGQFFSVQHSTRPKRSPEGFGRALRKAVRDTDSNWARCFEGWLVLRRGF